MSYIIVDLVQLIGRHYCSMIMSQAGGCKNLDTYVKVDYQVRVSIKEIWGDLYA